MNMRKIIVILIAAVFLAGFAWASEDLYTTHYHLTKPAKGAEWRTKFDANWDRVDAILYGLGAGNATNYGIFYPENYGTQGDGNDSDIVRMAVDAARSNGGGTIYIDNCNKDYTFNMVLRSISGVTVRGCARSYTTDASTAPNNGHPWTAADPSLPLITVGDSQNSARKTRGIIIRDFWMDGTDNNATQGIYIQEGSDVLVDNFDIKGFTHDAVKIGDANSTNVFDSDTVTLSNFMIFLGQQRGSQVVTGVHLVYAYAQNYIGWPHLLSGQIWEPQASSLTVDDPSLSYAIFNRGVGLVMTNVYIGTSTTRGFYLDQPVGVVIGAHAPPCTIWMNGVYLENNGQLACPGDPTNCHVSIKNAYNDQGPMAIFRGIGELSGKFETASGDTTGGILQSQTKSYQYIAKIYTPIIYNYAGFFGTTYVGSVLGSEDNGSEPNRRIQANDSTWNLDFLNYKAGAGFKFTPGSGGYTKVQHLHADNTTATFGYSEDTSVTINVGAGKYGLRALAANSDTEDSVPIYGYTQGDQQAGIFESAHGHGISGTAYIDGFGVNGNTDNGTAVYARNGFLLGCTGSPCYSTKGTGTAFKGEAYGADSYFLTGWTQSNSKGAIHIWMDPTAQSDNDTVIPMTIFKRYINTAESWPAANGIGFEHRSIIHNQNKDNEFIAAKHKIYLSEVTTNSENAVQEFVNAIPGPSTATALKLDGANVSVPTGTFEARIPLSIDTDNQTAVASTVLSHIYVNNIGTTTAKNYVISGAATGRTLCFKQYPGNTGKIQFHVPATHYVEIPATGAFGSVGKGLISGGAAKESVCIFGVDATHWLTWNPTGTWGAES